MGKPGRWAVSQLLPELKRKYQVDFTIANVENAAGGFGLTPQLSQKIYAYGVDVQTSGNHIWDRKEIYPYLEHDPTLLRPANYPAGVPGAGACVRQVKQSFTVAVINLQGRVFMADTECPFRTVDGELAILKGRAKIIIVDFHGEATSEKQAMGLYLDGKVSAVIGTHTHVQTADETLLPQGTAYLTDVGMTGPHRSVIGMRYEDTLARFLTQLPRRFLVATDDVKLCAVLLDVDEETGKARSIQRLRLDCAGDLSQFPESD